MVKKQGRARLYISCNYYSCTIYFLVKILLVKDPSHFSMLVTKLWHGKTESKNVKAAKMVEFIKTCDQCPPRRFNFGNFFNSIILPPPFCWGKNRSSENAVREEWAISFCLWGNDKNLGTNFTWGMSKNEQIHFFDSIEILSPDKYECVSMKLIVKKQGG